MPVFSLLLLFLLLADFVFLLQAEVLQNVGLEERFADGVELGLHVVDVVVQAAGEDFLGGAELQFGEQAAAEAFGVVAETALGDTGDATERGIQLLDTKPHRAREISGVQEEADDEPGFDLAAIEGFVTVPSAAGTEHGGPAEGVGLRGDVARRERGVLHVEQARGFVGAFDVAAGLREVPALVADDGGVIESLQEERAGSDFLEELERALDENEKLIKELQELNEKWNKTI